MKGNYSFLKDEVALLEIRKHKWIESQKQGQEIGFASAAIDWIKRYGENFRKYRLADESQDPLTEKRHFRRFQKKLPLSLATDNRVFQCYTNDINLIGLSCTIPEFIPNETATDISISFKQKGKIPTGQRFRFHSKIARITQPNVKHGYRVFIPFSEDVRDYLRRQAGSLS